MQPGPLHGNLPRGRPRRQVPARHLPNGSPHTRRRRSGTSAIQRSDVEALVATLEGMQAMLAESPQHPPKVAKPVLEAEASRPCCSSVSWTRRAPASDSTTAQTGSARAARRCGGLGAGAGLTGSQPARGAARPRVRSRVDASVCTTEPHTLARDDLRKSVTALSGRPLRLEAGAARICAPPLKGPAPAGAPLRPWACWAIRSAWRGPHARRPRAAACR